MSKFFITGGNGFLGNAMVDKLKKNKKNEVDYPSSKTLDLKEYSSLKNFSKKKYDYIFHLAAWTQAGDFCLYHKGEQWLINQQINTNVLKWWHEHQQQAKLLSIGTSCVYDENLPMIEENYFKGLPDDSLMTYAFTKRMLLLGCQSISHQFGLKWISYTPSTLYGLNYTTKDKQLHFIYDLIRKIIRGKIFNEEVRLWGDGYQKRELVYLDDFIKVIFKTYKNIENTNINVGSVKDYSIRKFAKIICKEVGYDFKKIIFDKKKYVGAKRKKLVNKNLKKIDHNLIKNFIQLEQGLKKVIKWFMINKLYL